MKRLRGLARSVAVVAAVVAVAPAVARSYVGKEFPDFTATDPLTGRTFSLKDLRGKVVLVDFWATWCGPCRRELPFVKDAYAAYKGQGFEIVSISLDSDEKRFKTFVGKSEMPWIHVMEGGGWSTRLARAYSIRSIPSMYVLDARGACIAERVRGPALERAVRVGLGLRGDPPARKAAEFTPVLPDDPDGRLARQLGNTRDELDRIQAPLRGLGRRLASASAKVDRIESSVARGGSDASPRLAAVSDQLRDARHELFMLGVIGGEQTIAVPSGSDADLQRQVSIAREAIAQMSEATAAADAELARLSARVTRLQRHAASRLTTSAAIERQITVVRDDALTVAESWCEPWIDQLDALERILEARSLPLAALQERLESAETRISMVRSELASNANLSQTLATAGVSFGEACVELREVYGQLDDLGLGSSQALPECRPPAAVEAMRVQLQAADDAVARARRTIAEHLRSIETLAGEAATIRGVVARRLADGGDLETLRVRFSELARKALQAQD